MTRNRTLRDHVAAAILDAAATVLAERGDAASMGDVAGAAGVGRTTLYRYFPNREELVRALARAALSELADKLAEAHLESAGVGEGVARVSRAVLGAASKYRALAHTTRETEASDEITTRLREPLSVLFQRGTADGTLRTDIGAETLLDVYVALIEGAVGQELHERLGTEQAAAAITSIFLDGARPGR
jgi:AcrR family transcriptional regulator